MPEGGLKRINKYLSEVGYCSRRAADKLIDQGRVTINGKVPEMGTKVVEGDQVHVDGVLVSPNQEELVYLAFHKPVGIVCTTDTRVEKDNIIDYINYPKRIFPKSYASASLPPVFLFKNLKQSKNEINDFYSEWEKFQKAIQPAS